MQTLVEAARQWGIGLAPEQVEQYRLYAEELAIWNRRVNLTSITEPEAVQNRHILDSLSLLRLDQPGSGFYALHSGPLLRAGARVVDVGAGAGFPGLALKVVRPDLSLCLVESVGKKAHFLRHMASTLGFEDVDVAVARAETLAHDPRYRESFDVVLSRAVAPSRTLVELCLPFATVGGFFVAHKKGDVDEELRAARDAMALLGGHLIWKEDYALPGQEEEHALLVIEKVSPTPERYPRQPGMPAKRPL